jgi:arsenate reductase (glutaredoxin)
MSSVTLYGLPNCDSTQAAQKWLKAKGCEPVLHNYKTDGITAATLKSWCKQLGWEKLLNKRSTTWRSLTKEAQDSVTDEASAIAVLLQNTSLIKRPVIEFGNNLLVGFDEKILSNIFK